MREAALCHLRLVGRHCVEDEPQRPVGTQDKRDHDALLGTKLESLAWGYQPGVWREFSKNLALVY